MKRPRSKNVHPKVAAAGAGGALATLVIYLASLAGADLTPEAGAAIATLISFAAGYLRPAGGAA